MATAPFIVVVDRGFIKAYEVKQTPTRGPAARLVQESELRQAHERYRDKVTDQAGAFPTIGSGGNANAIAERLTMEAEEDNRLFKSIAQEVEAIIHKHQPLRWSFAAPAEINSAILENIPKGLQEILVQNLKNDLVKIPADSLVEHFG